MPLKAVAKSNERLSQTRTTMTVPKIKICGITNAIDALHAVGAGADALGFVFYKKSPRHVSPTVVKRIVADLPPFVLPVGVFVNEEAHVVRDVMDACGLALAQIHGDETADYCETLGRPVIRGIRLRDRNTFLAMAEYKGTRAGSGICPGCLFGRRLRRDRNRDGLERGCRSGAILLVLAGRRTHSGERRGSHQESAAVWSRRQQRR